jgi:hypothetical protein
MNSFDLSRRLIVTTTACSFLPAGRARALPPGVEGLSVRIQLDEQSIAKIPGRERAEASVVEDRSAAAQALIAAAPRERAVPIILIVVGALSVPVIWDTVQEMLRRYYYGGVLVDARQTPVSITHDRTLPADLVLYIAPDGQSKRIAARDFTADLLGALGKQKEP